MINSEIKDVFSLVNFRWYYEIKLLHFFFCFLIVVLGVAITISCNYKKGEEIAQGWTGLCNLCWQWRKLPADYFPVLLNEVSCDTTDAGCLSGFIFFSPFFFFQRYSVCAENRYL